MVTSTWLFAGLIAAVGIERLAELVVSRRHVRAALDRGGVERGERHYPVMVLLHAGLLVGAIAEVALGDRPFHGWLGWPMLGVALAAQALRWWCIATLGEQWSTRVVVVPGAPLVSRGPYSVLRHPNYVAVVAEGVALPLVHSAWLTALVFTAANSVLLWVRIRCEDDALRELAGARR